MAELSTENPTASAATATETQSSCCGSAETSDAVVAARRVELFEPAMCCQTGVCGPSVDQQLIDVREDLRWAAGQGAEVTRHNLSSNPDAFVANPKITGLMAAFGEGALPALMIDGDIAVHGRYVSRDELAQLLDPSPQATTLPVLEVIADADADGCGCGPSDCC